MPPAYVGRNRCAGLCPGGCAPSSGLSSLGDIVCLEGDCKVGELLVREMQQVFRQLSGAGADELSDADVAFMQRFGPTVTQTIEAFERENAKLARQVPFTIVCCNIKELGLKAQGLTRQMRAARGVEQTDATPVKSPFDPGAGAIGTAAKVLLAALAAAIVVPPLVRSFRRRN